MNKPSQSKEGGLLERFQEKAGCPFLSDLHSGAFLEEIKAAALSIPDEEFSLREWNEAVSYITAQHDPARTVQEAKIHLWHWRG